MVGAPVNGSSARGWTSWFAGLKVGTKIATTLAVSMVACGAVALFGGLGLRDVDARSTAIYEENLKPSHELAIGQGAFDDALLSLTLMNISVTPAATAQHKQEVQAAAQAVESPCIVTRQSVSERSSRSTWTRCGPGSPGTASSPPSN